MDRAQPGLRSVSSDY